MWNQFLLTFLWTTIKKLTIDLFFSWCIFLDQMKYRSNKIIFSGDVLSEEEVMMLINAADKVMVYKFIYWPKFLLLSSIDHKPHSYWTHNFALILARTLINFFEASPLIVVRFSDDYIFYLFPPFSGWWWDSRLWGIREDHDVTSETRYAI